PILEDAVHRPGIAEQLLPTLAEWGEMIADGFEEPLLELAIPGAAGAELVLHALDFRRCGDEAEQLDDDRPLGVLGRLEWGGIGDDAHHPLPQRLVVQE